jgi:hypothetical protein
MNMNTCISSSFMALHHPTSLDHHLQIPKGVDTQIERLPTRLQQEAYFPLFFAMLTRWRIACSVLLPLNYLKIHFQGLPSFLHANRRCSCTRSHGRFTRVLKLWPSLLEPQSSSLLESGSLSLKQSLLLLQDGSLPCKTRAWASTLPG